MKSYVYIDPKSSGLSYSLEKANGQKTSRQLRRRWNQPQPGRNSPLLLITGGTTSTEQP
jgi:hypothetical protein